MLVVVCRIGLQAISTGRDGMDIFEVGQLRYRVRNRLNGRLGSADTQGTLLRVVRTVRMRDLMRCHGNMAGCHQQRQQQQHGRRSFAHTRIL